MAEAAMTWTWWAGQALGFIAMAVVLTSHWSRNRKTTVTRNGWASVIFSAHYLLLGIPGTAVIPAINAARGWLYTRDAGWARNRAWAPAFIALTWAVYLLINGQPASWAEWLPPIGSSLSAIALSLHDIRKVKAIMALAIAVWIVYEVAFGLWGVLGGEILGLGLTGAALVLAVREQPTKRPAHRGR